MKHEIEMVSGPNITIKGTLLFEGELPNREGNSIHVFSITETNRYLLVGKANRVYCDDMLFSDFNRFSYKEPGSAEKTRLNANLETEFIINNTHKTKLIKGAGGFLKFDCVPHDIFRGYYGERVDGACLYDFYQVANDLKEFSFWLDGNVLCELGKKTELKEIILK